MHDHVIALAVDRLLAGPMKVELFERILLPAHRHKAPCGVSDRHGVTVVDDMQRRRLVIELDWQQVGLLGIVDVDGGLPAPILAWSKFRFELTPMAWPTRLPIVPSVFGMMILARTEGGYM